MKTSKLFSILAMSLPSVNKLKINPKFLAALLAAIFALGCTSGLQAQILAQFYNPGGGQTLATATDFMNAGVTGLTGTESVSGFDIGANFNGNGGNLTATSGDITITKGSNAPGFSYGGGDASPVYQQTLLDTNDVTITGLSSVLVANTTYNLFLLANSVTFTPGSTLTDNSFAYGSQTDAVDNLDTVRGTVIPFSFTTGSTVLDTLTLTVTGSASDPADYPGISGFAIVGTTVPEPSTYVLMLGGLGVLVFFVLRRQRNA